MIFHNMSYAVYDLLDGTRACSWQSLALAAKMPNKTGIPIDGCCSPSVKS